MSRHTWAASLLTAEIAVLVGLALLLQALHPTAATHAWEIGLGTIGVALLLAIVVLVVGILRDHPRLVVGEPVVEAVTIEGTQMGFLGVYLHVWNNQGSRVAESVHLKLRFVRAATTLYSLAGRWSYASQNVGYESTQRPVQEDLAPNGVRHMLDVAAKFADESQCHALDDKSRYLGWKRHPLGTEPVIVEVEAVGVGSKAHTVSRWVLTCDAPLGIPRLEPQKIMGRVGRVALRSSRWAERRWGSVSPASPVASLSTQPVASGGAPAPMPQEDPVTGASVGLGQIVTDTSSQSLPNRAARRAISQQARRAAKTNTTEPAQREDDR